MKLSQLLKAIGKTCPEEREITAITCDSRQCVPGSLFVALPGAKEDGRAFVQEALERGAAAVVCQPPLPDGIPGAAVEDARAALSLLAAEFYGNPAKEMCLIAVTGTKGKTTTAHMIQAVFTAAGKTCGMIGTLGSWIGRTQIQGAANTTPEPCALQETLRRMADQGCTHVVMEVSSQAMKLKRVYGISFDAALFLNLSPDHIGGAEHGSFEEYRGCKAELFRQCTRLALGNAADPAWPVMAAQVPPEVPILSFYLSPPPEEQGMPENNTYSPDLSDFSASAMTPKRMPASAPAPASGTEPYPPLLGRILSERGFSQTILAGDREYLVPMPGRFNGENALAAIAVCRSLGVQESEIAAGLLAVSVPGRTERYPAAHAPFEIVLDYAHNGESFRALFAALRPHTKGRILAVFGAGGDRPKLRRTDMGRAAAEGADLAILTEDNPRSEKTEDICRQIGAAIGERIPWLILPDRAEAIRFALRMAQPGDAVALLGKGHETYIEENGVRRYFSEREVLDQWFAGSRAGSKGAEQSS